jgi:hypothetical protein
MNKLMERMITAAGIITLLAVFCYQIAYGMSETITNGNTTATITAPSGSKINNFTIIPESHRYVYPPPTITYSWEPANDTHCVNCAFQTFTIQDGGNIYKGYRYSGSMQAHPGNLNLCAHKEDMDNDFSHPIKDCVTLWPQGHYPPTQRLPIQQ